MRILAWFKILVLFLLVSVAASYFIYKSDWFQKKFLYPFPYQSLIFQYAIANEVDPFLVAGLIRTESKFIPHARSPKGAIGLMQIMPETGSWVAEQLKMKEYSPNYLDDPETNIRLGIWYLALLTREFAGNEVLLLAAYNGGIGNVRQWMRQYGWSLQFSDINQIPFRETREYVGKVLRDRKCYQELYGR